MLKYQGLGGVDGVVAGSTHVFTLITPRGVEKLLHDCGDAMEHGQNMVKIDYKSLANRLTTFCVSHSHFDHAGKIAEPFFEGYNGKVFMQKANFDLIKGDLRESAGMEYSRLKSYNESIKGRRDASGDYIPFAKPKINTENLNKMVNNFVSVDYEKTIQVSPNIQAIFHDAGHILGSAAIEYLFNDGGKIKRVLMAVDLGRDDINIPIINPPYRNFKPGMDYCFIESTYGSRQHLDRQTTREGLEESMMRLISEESRGLMASFAKMRSQWILWDLFDIYKSGKFPSDFKIYFDSPSAIQFNRAIVRHPECLDQKALDELFLDGKKTKENLFKFPNLVYVESRADSQALDSLKGPHLVISASGMWFLGRVKNHLPAYIEDPNASLFRTGYQVSGCLGGLLEAGKEKNPKITIDNKSYQYNAKWCELRGYSAHADGNTCVDYISNSVKPKKTFIVHGEKESSEWTLRSLQQKNQSAEIVRKNKVYDL
jgi:metallo-beta-lactamase family protein